MVTIHHYRTNAEVADTNARFLQTWCSVAHANYEHCRNEALKASSGVAYDYFASEARIHAAARAVDFKHCWHARFGQREPEPWA